MTDAVIIDAVRTPIGKGKPGGALAGVHPAGLHAHAIRSLMVLPQAAGVVRATGRPLAQQSLTVRARRSSRSARPHRRCRHTQSARISKAATCALTMDSSHAK